MPNAYAFRLKPSKIDRVLELLAVNQIAIGWSKAKGLDDPKLTFADFRAEVGNRYPEIVKRKRVGHDAGHLWRFIRKMNIGDVVVVPRGNNIHFLQVTSDTKYLAKEVKEDTAYRRDVCELPGSPAFRPSLPAKLRKALCFRDTSIDLSHLLNDILSVTSLPTAPLIAVESSEEVRSSVGLWRSAFESTDLKSSGSSAAGLYVSELGVWLKAIPPKAGELSYHNEAGTIAADGKNLRLVVMINLADGGLPGRFQGLIAKTGKGQTWLLHSGELNLQRRKVVHLKDHLSTTELQHWPVEFSDGKVRNYHPVARLDQFKISDSAAAMEVVAQSRQFINTCISVRDMHAGIDPKVTYVQRQACLFEESLGRSFVPQKDSRFTDRVHAKIWHALVKALEDRSYLLSNQRVGALGPDLFTLQTSPPYLFEIKTSCGASDYLKGVGQLLVYEKALESTYRKFLVIPAGIDDKAADILENLDIEILEYCDTSEGVSFKWPEKF